MRGTGYDDDYRKRKILKEWMVIDSDGQSHLITAHYCFNNGPEGLLFRRYREDSNSTEVVASFAFGAWKFFKEVSHHG